MSREATHAEIWNTELLGSNDAGAPTSLTGARSTCGLRPSEWCRTLPELVSTTWADMHEGLKNEASALRELWKADAWLNYLWLCYLQLRSPYLYLKV